MRSTGASLAPVPNRTVRPNAFPYSSGSGSGGIAPRARASHSTASPSAFGMLVRLNVRESRVIHDANRRDGLARPRREWCPGCAPAPPTARRVRGPRGSSGRRPRVTLTRVGRIAREVVARVARRREIAKRRVVVLLDQPGLAGSPAPRCANLASAFMRVTRDGRRAATAARGVVDAGRSTTRSSSSRFLGPTAAPRADPRGR